MDFETIKRLLPDLLTGSVITLELTFLSIIFGTIIGVLVAIIKISNIKIISYVANVYTWLIRGTPLLLQLFVFYYGLPALNINLSPINAAIIGLSINAGAYMAEIVRGGILAIDRGQFEASKALGFTYFQTMKRIILPQAFRVVVPPVGNQFIGMIKDTSLVSVITIEELLRKASLQVSASGNVFEPYLMTAALYLIMTTLFTSIFGSIEKKLSVY